MVLALLFALGYLAGAASALLLLSLTYASRSREARALEALDRAA
jgi:hypothetical protein